MYTIDKTNKSAAKKKKKAQREQAFAIAHPDIQTSADVYNTLASRAPLVRAYYDRLRLKRLPFAPEPLPRFKAGFARALKHVHLADNEGSNSEGLKTFLPPVSMFTESNMEKPERVLRYLVMLVWLRPTFLSRVELARKEKAVVRFGIREWKIIMGGEYFIFNMPEGERGKLRVEDFWVDPHKYWKYGGEQLWGRKVSQALLADPNVRPHLGTLACGHEPTTDEFANNPDLAECVIYELNQLALLHHLARLVKPEDLKKADVTIVQEPEKIRAINGVDVSRIPSAAGPSRPVGAHPTRKSSALDRQGLPMSVPTLPKSQYTVVSMGQTANKKDALPLFAHATPTILELQSAKDSSMLGLVRRVVLHDNKFEEDGRPPTWSASSVHPPERRAWLSDFKTFLARAANARELDRVMANDPEWLSLFTLGNKNPGSMNSRQQEDLEEHLFWRYALTSFKCGQLVPLDFFWEPRDERGKCEECRVVVLKEGEIYGDLPDEPGDWNDMDEYY